MSPTDIDVKAPRFTNKRSSIDKAETVFRIIRFSNQAVIIDQNGEMVPVTKENVMSLRKKALANKKTVAKIQTIGLSRAEVSRIIRDIASDSTVGVFSQKNAPKSSAKPSPNRFEILLSER